MGSATLPDSDIGPETRGLSIIASKALALVAILLYTPGILLPAMHVEKMGRVRESSLFDSFRALIHEHEWLLASVVLVSVLILPPLKLLGLVWLEWEGSSRPGRSGRWHRVLEFAGRFGLLEVFLAALLIALIRFDALLHFEARPGLYLFVLSAVCGLAAALILSYRSAALRRPT